MPAEVEVPGVGGKNAGALGDSVMHFLRPQPAHHLASEQRLIGDVPGSVVARRKLIGVGVDDFPLQGPQVVAAVNEVLRQRIQQRGFEACRVQGTWEGNSTEDC